MSKLDTGKSGEQFAAEMLESKGYTVICTNYYSRYGEIDVVCENDKYLVFVEVKTRSNKYAAMPREYVTAKKRDKLVKTALMYLSAHRTKLQTRFDVVEVITSSQNGAIVAYNHIENAFMLW